MSLTVTEASEIGTVIRYWLEMDSPLGDPITDGQVIDAMAHLADQAHRKLMAGITGDQARARWAELDRSSKTDTGDQAVGQ